MKARELSACKAMFQAARLAAMWHAKQASSAGDWARVVRLESHTQTGVCPAHIAPWVYKTVGQVPGSILPRFADGGYPVLYCGKYGVLCADCANKGTESVVDAGVYWEGPDEQCGACERVIPSAYGDPDAKEEVSQ